METGDKARSLQACFMKAELLVRTDHVRLKARNAVIGWQMSQPTSIEERVIGTCCGYKEVECSVVYMPL